MRRLLGLTSRLADRALCARLTSVAADAGVRPEWKMKPGSRDIKVKLLIDGEELTQLKRHAWQMAEAFGLDSRIEQYQGKRPIGFYRWDMDCLIDVVDMSLDDKKEYPTKDSPEHMALKMLYARLKAAYQRTFD